MTMITKNELIASLRSKNKELEDQLEAVRKHFEKIPVISISFLSCEEDAIKEYIRDMDNWGEELQKLL